MSFKAIPVFSFDPQMSLGFLFGVIAHMCVDVSLCPWTRRGVMGGPGHPWDRGDSWLEDSSTRSCFQSERTVRRHHTGPDIGVDGVDRMGVTLSVLSRVTYQTKDSTHEETSS